MITTVSNSAAFQAAITAAQSGDTILLAPGSYGALSANGLHFAQDVTIASQNPGAPARLSNLFVDYSSGLTFSNLEVVVSSDNAIRVSQSQDVHLDRFSVHGSLDGNAQNDGSGVLFQNGSDLSFTNSEFQQLTNAFGHLNVTGLTVANNAFHDIRTDAVRGGGSSNVTVTANTFRDFYPVSGDHADPIQFWTTNTTAPVHDILISENQFFRGSGTAPQGGIFFNDEVGGLAPQHVTIIHNLIVGAAYNGVALLGGADVTIRDNVVQGFPDFKSWILLSNTNGAAVSGNYANEYPDWGGNSNLSYANNQTTPLTGDGGAAALALWTQLGAGGGSGSGLNLTGTAANDTLQGGAGADTLTDPGGANYLRGGDGADQIFGGAGFDNINGNLGDDTVHGGAADDWVLGGQANDILFGEDGQDLVLGNLGADTVDGGAGADTVRGGQAEDLLTGGAGADWLSGDRGDDTESGGAGADIFHGFADAGLDRILDFNGAEGDRILLDPGTTYALGQVGGDTVISLGGGAQMVLVGVQAATFSPGWITVG